MIQVKGLKVLCKVGTHIFWYFFSGKKKFMHIEIVGFTGKFR